MIRRGRRFTHHPTLHRMIHAGLFILVVSVSVIIASMGRDRPAGDSFARAETPKTVKPEETPNTPIAFRARGRLVCLAEEMKERFGADVQPVHDHVLGFRLEKPAGNLRYPLILRSVQSEALFVDDRFAKQTLVLSGRVFPGTGILEVSGWHWERDGKTYDVYYWCDVCSIRGVTPGACACCQDEVELRERVVPAPREE